MLAPLPLPFLNDAGEIQNLVELGPDDAFRGVALIRCRAGSRRSSHYHRGRDSHYLFVLSGEMVYTQRNYGSGTVVKFSVKPGQMVYTPPRVEHWTEFPVETVLISITRLPGNAEHEADLVRVPWIEESA